MDAQGTVVGVIVGATVGIVAAVVTLKAEREAMKAELEEAVHEAQFAAYNDGWRAALDHPGHVRTAYTKHFDSEEKDEARGTNFKGFKKA